MEYAFKVIFEDKDRKQHEYLFDTLQDAIKFQVDIHAKGYDTHLKRVALNDN
tara:strand:+ start:356 stop:511 length:156 start_codon:yes stop_codon:yes gene_type:complete